MTAKAGTRKRMALQTVIPLLFTLAACSDNPAWEDCHHVEGLAYSDSVSILNTAHVGDTLQVRVSGSYGWCYSILRVEIESRVDTVLIAPIAGGLSCPRAKCAPGIKQFVDTLAIRAERPGWLWVRLEASSARLIDSTLVLRSEAPRQ
jgi:hypothetical protein